MSDYKHLKSTDLFKVNDPCINDVRGETLPGVGDDDHGTLVNILSNVVVCEMNLEEDDRVLFHFRITNTDTSRVRIFHCQPFQEALWKRVELLGPFDQVSGHDFFKAGTAPNGWRADNDSNSFYAEVNVGGSWRRMGQLTQIRATGDAKVAHMEWHEPHEVRFEIRAVDTRDPR